MVGSYNLYSQIATHNAHIIHCCQQAWIREDGDVTLDTIQEALMYKRIEVNMYIKFINHFGPALTGEKQQDYRQQRTKK
jgi:hypothetical protein